MKIKFYQIVLLSIFMISCNNNVNKIIKHQDELIHLSSNKEIIADDYRTYHSIRTFNNSLENEYFFKKENDSVYYLSGDSIQFNPDTIIGINVEDQNYKLKVVIIFERQHRC